jgi:NAD(P)-dependent dehydrogenase (short-subunit alcohol dehydrogenase family)
MSQHPDAPQRADGLAPAVLITGSSTGIGAACAVDLDRRGLRVFAGVRSEADGERLRRQASERLSPVRIDVTQSETIRAAAEQVTAAVGEAGLAGLVNNAGVLVSAPVELVGLDTLRWQLEVNVIGVVAVTQAFLPLLRAGRGRIVNIGSISGKVVAPCLGPYAASKFALEALTDALRVELRRWGICVSIVEPDSVRTPIWDKALSRAQDDRTGQPAATGELYQEELIRMRKAAYVMGKTGMPVQRVVRAVRHALCARRPKTRYPVGLRTRLAFWATRHVPDRLRDWFIVRAVRTS